MTWLDGQSTERLLSTCYQDRVGQALAPDIKDFSSFVYDKRCGTVSHCMLNILRCEAALRQRWNLKTCLSGSNIANDGHDLAGTVETRDSLNLSAIDEAISLPFWWQYLRLRAAIAIGPCCKRTISDKLKTLWKSCPLRGRRCADLACGKFWGHVQRLGGKSNKQFQGSGSLV